MLLKTEWSSVILFMTDAWTDAGAGPALG